MAGKFADLQALYTDIKDNKAEEVAFLWSKWNNERQGKIQEWLEVRNYVFATDTSTTTNSTLPWKNSTTIPKLCQIRDNLHANYLSALVPNDNLLRWVGESEEDQAKARYIIAYMRDKAHQSRLRDTLSQLLYDFIDYGMAFATAEYEKYQYTTPKGRTILAYDGPVAIRISPLDIVFNPVAPTFQESPKIIRSIKTLGEIQALSESSPEWKGAFEKTLKMRKAIGAFTVDDTHKALGFSMDGFGSLQEYYGSNYVEVLTFKGDFYDSIENKGLINQQIIVIDRSILVSHTDNPSWLGRDDIHFAGWRKRPDNLYCMGPLENLIGMQYRLDHLENLKADAMDLLVHPPLKITGDVEPFVWGPNAEIHIIGEGDVTEMGLGAQGVTVASNEIASLEMRMEEYAGAPKQAMGIRTPGEKTMYEVQQLENAAGRIFQEKIVSFEISCLEPLLNNMLAIGRANFGSASSIKIFNDELGISVFESIQPEDLVANGLIRPVGARHFGEQAQLIQNLSQLFGSPLGQKIDPHWSAEKTAQLIEDAMDLEKYGLVQKNIGLVEAAETQDVANHLGQVVAERQVAPS
jgi:hypothetical protein